MTPFSTENFICLLAIYLHNNSILTVWNWKLLKTGFKVQVFENDAIIVSVKTIKKLICENSDFVCKLNRDIANYWHHMSNTAFLGDCWQ